MWYKTQSNNLVWVDKNKYICIQPYLKNNKIKYRISRYNHNYNNEVLSCIHPLVIFSRCNHYIKKILHQYGIRGLLSMLRKPPTQPIDIQFAVQSKVKKKRSKIEKSGYQGSIPMDTNSSGVMVVTEKC